MGVTGCSICPKMGDAVARTLFKYGIVTQEIYPAMVVDENFYEHFGIE